MHQLEALEQASHVGAPIDQRRSAERAAASEAIERTQAFHLGKDARDPALDARPLDQTSRLSKHQPQ